MSSRSSDPSGKITLLSNRELICFDSLQEAAKLFNSLFGTISRVKYEIDSHSDQLNTAVLTAISEEVLMSEQKEALKNLSGFLGTALLQAAKPKPYAIQNDRNDETVECIDSLRLENLKSERHNLKIISALQDFLVQEVNRNDILEQKIKRLESELVDVTAHRNKLALYQPNSCQENAKRLKSTPQSTVVSSSSSSASSLSSRAELDMNRPISSASASELVHDISSATSNKTSLTSSTPVHCFIDKFVRKNFGGSFFFGIIVSFKTPYFKVVYEDADREELTRAQVLSILWSTYVPANKEAQCRKHAQITEGYAGNITTSGYDDVGNGIDNQINYGNSKKVSNKKPKLNRNCETQAIPQHNLLQNLNYIDEIDKIGNGTKTIISPVTQQNLRSIIENDNFEQLRAAMALGDIQTSKQKRLFTDKYQSDNHNDQQDRSSSVDVTDNTFLNDVGVE